MNSPTTLVLISGSYPYEIARENTFLGPELSYLRAQFDRVIIVPCRIGGQCCALPAGIEVDEGYALKSHSLRSQVRIGTTALTLSLFWEELCRRPRTLVQPGALRNLVLVAGENQRMRGWMRIFIRRTAIDLERAIFYTYWLGVPSLGIGLLKQEFPNLKVISRAHGYDVYEHRFRPPYIPLQAECIKHLDRVFFISEDGKNYIRSRFPWFADSCEVSRLGVQAPGGGAQPSRDGIYRIVSCSYLVSVKRIDLLLQGLISLAQSHPGQQFEWFHLGDGPLLDDLRRQAHTAPANLSTHFLGHLTNETVLGTYRGKPFDLFVNVSSSEGISVAIMEAMSCGIPVVATAVGGTPEIVSDQNGALLPKDPTAVQIAETLWGTLNDPVKLAIKREESLATRQERFNADANFDAFARRIRALII
jgi:glycosyltransferase involved in cell wall biosynthesis